MRAFPFFVSLLLAARRWTRKTPRSRGSGRMLWWRRERHGAGRDPAAAFEGWPPRPRNL